ncbi:hypothetical protein ACHAWO_013412 [Cyclotella atomus]|uniref:Uncharacterized protein n=1 Tax=Cyclotella atomus TaxID=382360 RepID=A0ABD3P0K2_9STRA
MTFTGILLQGLTLIQLLHPSASFSAWLPCHRYLEEDEVIMNNKVAEAPTDADNIVALAVYDSTGSRVDESSIVWIDEGALPPSKSVSFRIQIDPATTEGLSDVQFVLEAHPFKDDAPNTPSSAPNAGAPTPHVPSAPAPVAPVKKSQTGFTGASAGGGVMCDGKRSHARGKTGYVTFELSLASDYLKHSDQSCINYLSEVWAGYAEGHSKVTLTPKIYFMLRGTKEGTTTNDEL